MTVTDGNNHAEVNGGAASDDEAEYDPEKQTEDKYQFHMSTNIVKTITGIWEKDRLNG